MPSLVASIERGSQRSFPVCGNSHIPFGFIRARSRALLALRRNAYIAVQSVLEQLDQDRLRLRVGQLVSHVSLPAEHGNAGALGDDRMNFDVERVSGLQRQ